MCHPSYIHVTINTFSPNVSYHNKVMTTWSAELRSPSRMALHSFPLASEWFFTIISHGHPRFLKLSMVASTLVVNGCPIFSDATHRFPQFPSRQKVVVRFGVDAMG